MTAAYNEAVVVTVKTWHVYIIRCGDGTLYTGMTVDLQRRFVEHVEGDRKAARYLKGRGPLELVFSCKAGDRARAMKLERRIKGLSRERKIALVENPKKAEEFFRS